MLNKLTIILFALSVSSIVFAETRYVANNGVDSNNCGSKSSPCRTISKGIVNSGVNDLIRVGPGVYGDINNDGDFSDSGEESELNEDGALIKISKPVRIVSTHGARATFIQASGATDFVFYLAASKIRIGKKRQGFTIKDAGEANVFIAEDRARILGNIISSSYSGAIGVLAGCFDGDDYGSPQRVSIVDNLIIFNQGTGVKLCSNTNKFGIRKNDISNNGSQGMYLEGSAHRIIQNSISGNQSTAVTILAEDVRFVRNVLVANQGSAVSSGGENLEATSNSIIGNDGTGIFFYANTTLNKNNVFENFFDSLGSVYENCGVFDNGNETSINKTYYGASTGPGSDPADFYCSQIKANEDENYAKSQHSIRIPRPVQ